MPTKQEVLDSIQNRTYTESEVIGLIHSIKNNSLFNNPSKILKGDIILLYNNTKGIKKRPAVVIKVLKETVVVLPLTTTNDHNVLMRFNTRFKEENYISKNMNTLTIEYAKENHIGIFENRRALNKAIKLFKEYVSII